MSVIIDITPFSTHTFVKCQRLFKPQFSKVKTRFVVQNRQVSDTLTPSDDVSETPFK